MVIVRTIYKKRLGIRLHLEGVEHFILTPESHHHHLFVIVAYAMIARAGSVLLALSRLVPFADHSCISNEPSLIAIIPTQLGLLELLQYKQ
jgi:hypothetical protein